MAPIPDRRPDAQEPLEPLLPSCRILGIQDVEYRGRGADRPQGEDMSKSGAFVPGAPFGVDKLKDPALSVEYCTKWIATRPESLRPKITFAEAVAFIKEHRLWMMVSRSPAVVLMSPDGVGMTTTSVESLARDHIEQGFCRAVESWARHVRGSAGDGLTHGLPLTLSASGVKSDADVAAERVLAAAEVCRDVMAGPNEPGCNAKTVAEKVLRVLGGLR